MRHYLFILFLFLLLYLFRLYSALQAQPKIPQEAEIKLIARISQQPYLSGSNQIIRASQFLIKTERFPSYFYGQKIEVIGRVKKRVLNWGKTDFVFNYPTIRILEEEKNLINQTKIMKGLLLFRERLEKIFLSLLPDPQVGLLAGIVLGSKKQLLQDFLQNLRKTGTMHVVVASGYNITVIAGFLISFLAKFISRKKALELAFLGIFAYTLMAGAEPAIVRAAIMGSLTYLAQFLGREKDAVVSLLFAAAVMLFFNPLILFDIGFQLSFLATGGILLLGPTFKGRIFAIPVVGENLRTTLAAQLGVLPILLANFGEINFLSPLINMLVLPAVPLIMGLGAVIAGLGLVYRFLALPIAWLVWLPLTYFVKVIGWFSNSPFNLLIEKRIPFLWVVGYYCLLGIWLLKRK